MDITRRTLLLALFVGPTNLFAEDKDPELASAEALVKTLSRSQKSKLTKLVNSGKKDDLMELPRIGESTASAIIKARPFKSSAHLVTVRGIGEKTFAAIIKAIKEEG